MQDNHEDRMTVYEIGYLISSSIPEEKVELEVEAIKKIISDAGASVVSEENPHMEDLAYTIRRKTTSGSYDKYDKAYFGWIKFEVGSSSIEAIKKSVEIIPSIVRMLLITTVRENTFLGKHAPAIAAKAVFSTEDGKITPATNVESLVDSAPATIEEIDKSIDNMVKEA
jgi:ribosomal protein S6